MHELLGAGPEDLEDLTQRPPGGNHAELR
jgi:hypothetical protein